MKFFVLIQDNQLMETHLQQLYIRAISDRPALTMLQNYNRYLAGPGQRFKRLFTKEEIQYFQRRHIDVAAVSRSKFGDGLLVSVVSNKDVKKAFGQYTSTCLEHGHNPHITDRMSAHLARLTSPRRIHIEAEKVFGIALLRNKYRINHEVGNIQYFLDNHVPPLAWKTDAFLESPEYRLLNSHFRYGKNAIQGEGEATIMFWSFGPYLHKALTEKHRLSADASIMMIASWPFLHERAIDASDNYRNLLFGLEDLNEPVFLGDDPSGPSHEFVALKAEEVAERLIQKAA